METCLVGLYCLHTPSAAAELSKDNGKRMRELTKYITQTGVGPDVFTPEVVDALAETMGGAGQLPKLFEMAESVAGVTQQTYTMDLYQRIYVPTSAFFVHSGGIALLRHVGADHRLRSHPSFPWSRRSAVHAADATLGILALAIADKTDRQNAERFADYANAHMHRTTPPIISLVARQAIRNVEWSSVPASLWGLRTISRYYHSGEAAAASRDEREAQTEKLLRQIVRPLDSVTSEEAFDLLAVQVVPLLANLAEQSDRGDIRAEP